MSNKISLELILKDSFLAVLITNDEGFTKYEAFIRTKSINQSLFAAIEVDEIGLPSRSSN
jgi:hypothetical protein